MKVREKGYFIGACKKIYKYYDKICTKKKKKERKKQKKTATITNHNNQILKINCHYHHIPCSSYPQFKAWHKLKSTNNNSQLLACIISCAIDFTNDIGLSNRVSVVKKVVS